MAPPRALRILHGGPIARDCGQEADDLEAWAEEFESEAVLMRATTEGNARTRCHFWIRNG